MYRTQQISLSNVNYTWDFSHFTFKIIFGFPSDLFGPNAFCIHQFHEFEKKKKYMAYFHSSGSNWLFVVSNRTQIKVKANGCANFQQFINYNNSVFFFHHFPLGIFDGLFLAAMKFCVRYHAEARIFMSYVEVNNETIVL